MHLSLCLVLFLSATLFQIKPVQSFDIRIKENIPENAFIKDLKSFDHHMSDSYKNSQFNLIPSTNSKINSLFDLKDNGMLYTAKLIDREVLCLQIDECCGNKDPCLFTILVAVSSSFVMSPRTLEYRIHIEDENDNYPNFTQSKITINIKESEPVGTIFRIPKATDIDSEKFSIKHYKLVDELSSSPIFSLERIRPSADPVLKLIQRLDREKKSSYGLTVTALDGGIPPLEGKLLVQIKILDVNDNPPRLLQSNYEVTQKESQFLTEALLTIKATDDDEHENAELCYKIISESPTQDVANKFFRIEQGTGKIFLNEQLDYEKQDRYRFFVEVSNKNGNMETATATVLVNVENWNDEKPEISVNYLNTNKNNADIQENDIRNKFVALVTVSDKDKGIGGQVSCKLLNFEDTFEIHINEVSRFPNQYEIRTKISLDREKVSSYKIIMECEDKGYPSIKTKTEIYVIVQDLNDNAPIIRIDEKISIKENLPKRTTVTTIRATDADQGVNGELVFSISGSDELTLSLLEINSATGVLTTKEIIDREGDIKPLKTLSVVLSVSDKGKLQLSRSLSFEVKIEDENDNAPKFSSEIIQFSVTENEPARFTLGDISVTDADDDATLQVTLAPSTDNQLSPFTIFKRDNKFLLNTTRSLDWEKEKSFSLNVVASDGFGSKSHTATAEIRVTVIDENDNEPKIIFPTTKNFTIPRLSFFEKSGFLVLTVSAIDKDSQSTNNGKLSYQIYDNKDLFFIDSTRGDIKTLRQMQRADIGRFEIKVTVSDFGTPPKESSINLFIDVVDSKPQVYNDSNRDKDDNNGAQTNNYLMTKEGFLVISLIVLLLFLLICVFMILYMRHIRGLFPALPDIFMACRRSSKHRKCPKSSSCAKMESNMPFDTNYRNSPLTFQQTNRPNQEKVTRPYYLNQCDVSANNMNLCIDQHLPINPYRQYETMKYQPYSVTSLGPVAAPSVPVYNYDKLFYLPSTSRCESTVAMSHANSTNNTNFYSARSPTFSNPIINNTNNRNGCQRIINNIENSPLISDRRINDNFKSDPCLKIDNAEKDAIDQSSVVNTAEWRGHARPGEKIDTYAITYPVEQSTFV